MNDAEHGIVIGRNLIGGEWIATGTFGLAWHSPAEPARQVFVGAEVAAHVDEAIHAARRASDAWRGLGLA
jgi:acyl-CoA reductase-like NAD-dependent aldehyde dehydrogenase